MSPEDITEREVENNKTYDMLALMSVAVLIMAIVIPVAKAVKAGFN